MRPDQDARPCRKHSYHDLPLEQSDSNIQHLKRGYKAEVRHVTLLRIGCLGVCAHHVYRIV